MRKEKHVLKITQLVEIIAEGYYQKYKKLGGGLSHKEMINDFMIVACAALHGLDMVVSDDSRSMLSVSAKKAYKEVGLRYQLRTPQFIRYRYFKKNMKRFIND